MFILYANSIYSKTLFLSDSFVTKCSLLIYFKVNVKNFLLRKLSLRVARSHYSEWVSACSPTVPPGYRHAVLLVCYEEFVRQCSEWTAHSWWKCQRRKSVLEYIGLINKHIEVILVVMAVLHSNQMERLQFSVTILFLVT